MRLAILLVAALLSWALVLAPAAAFPIYPVPTDLSPLTALATGARPSAAQTLMAGPGDSRMNQTIRYNLNGNSSDTYSGHGFYTMLVARSGGRLQPFTITGWPQVSGTSAGGIVEVLVANGGSGYTAPTLTVATNTGCSGATLGAPVLDSRGAIVSVPVSAQGLSCANAPVITVTDPTGSGAQLLAQTNASGGFAASGIGTAEMVAYTAREGAAGGRNALFLGGTNDNARGLTLAQTKANKLAIIQGLANSGVRSIVVAELDRDGSTGSAAKKQNLANRLFDFSLAWRVPGTLVCDPTPYISDPNTGSPLAGVYVDGLHFTWYGADLAAKACWSQIAPFFPAAPPLTTQSATWDLYDAALEPNGNLISQPLVATGTATAVTGGEAPWTGTRPANVQLARVTGGTGTGTITASQVARVDGRAGTALRLTLNITGATAGEVYRLIWTPSNGSMTSATLGVGGANTLQIGQTIVGTIDDAYFQNVSGIRKVALKLVAQGLSSTITPAGSTIGANILQTEAWGDVDDDTFPPLTGDHYWLQTRQMKIPANTLGVTFMLEIVPSAAAATITVDLFGASVRYPQ